MSEAYEEDMVRLASEMSLMEDSDMDFDPYHLDEARDKIKQIESIVDEHLISDQADTTPDAVDSEPISSAQIREIFAVTEVRMSSKGSTPLLNQNSGSYRERDSADSIFSAFSMGQDTPLSGAKKKESMQKDTVISLRWKLQWYQKKVVHQIEETHEHHTYADGRLAVLLDLNDYITAVLSKLDMAANTVDDLLRPAILSMTGDNTPVRDMRQDFAVEVLPPQAAQQAAAAAGQSFPSVVSAVYALRRGGTRQETLNAVDNLIQLCNFGGELCLPAVKQMMAAGALQSLLSTLQRAADWPEVEKQISKVISILVTYEDDWALLQRSALIILTALYTLQVKTLTQCKISAKAASDATLGDSDGDIEIANRSRTASCSSQVTVPSTTTPRWDGRQGMPMSPPLKTSRSDELRLAAASAGIAALGAPAGTAAGSGKRPGKYGETYYGHPTASLDSEVEELLHHQRDQAQVREKAEYMRRLLEEAEEEQENLKALISAAVAKLSLVLASEWGKLATPLGGFGSMGGGAGPGVGPGGAGGLGLGLGGLSNASIRGDSQRRPSMNGRNMPGSMGMSQGLDAVLSGMSVGGGNRAVRPRSVSGAAVDNDRVLNILLNLIETLADDSVNATRMQLNTVGAGTVGTLGVAAITKILVKSMHNEALAAEEEFDSLNLMVKLPPVDTSITPLSDIASVGVSLGSEPNWQSTLSKPENVTRQNSTSSGTESVPTAEQEEELMKQGAIFFSPLMRVDSAAVLCSAALCNLAEVPQCRPGLVSSGALKMIKGWLEIGNDVLAQARVLCFHKLSSPRASSARAFAAASDWTYNSAEDHERQHQANQSVRDSCNAFMEAFGPAYELISNAAAALMHLSGGTDCRFATSSTANAMPRTSAAAAAASSMNMHGAGGRDYIVGWIDAQILAEGLPAVVVRMLHTSIEAFTTLPRGESSRPTRSVLPAAVGMHLAQTLFQLCSRVQNRQQLQSIDIPYALSILFENISGQTKLITGSHSDADSDSGDESSDDTGRYSGAVLTDTGRDLPPRVYGSDTVYSYIFHFGGIYTTRSRQNTSASNLTPRSGSGGGGPVPVTLKRDNSSDFLTLYSANVDNKFMYRRNMSAKAPTAQRPGHPALARPSLNLSQPVLRKPALPTEAPFMKLVPEDLMPIMASITSSCLDALTYFFADEISRVLPFANPGMKSKGLGSGGSSRASALEFTYRHYYASIVDLMCSERIIDSIKMTTSFLTRGAGRLAAVRIISALTEWPESLTALYEGGVMDVLMLISSESEEIEAQRIAASKLDNNEREAGTSFFSTIFPGKPQPAERTTSGASTISAISSATSKGRYDRSGFSPHDYDHDPDEDDDFNRISEVSLEETLSVCYALANLCEANSAYALRMFHSGLFAIMMKLVRSKHMEIGRQALRCISAMCGSVAHDPAERAKYVKVRGHTTKNAVFLEAMHILTGCLKSPSSLLQKGATHTIALLALINEQLQDAVVEGPLRSIILMLVDPKSDRDVRSAAEEVLKSLGFLSGVKDLELCGYDFEILRDWYAMKRSQKPQEEALQLLRDWVDRLFSEEQDGQTSFHLHRETSESIAAANDLVHEAAIILNAPITGLTAGSKAAHHHPNAGSRDSFDGGADASTFLGGGNFNPTASVISGTTAAGTSTSGRLAPLSMPQLQRNFTESILRFLPFCIKSPFQDGSQTTPANRSSAHHNEDGYDNSPAAGGAQFMNRSLHPSSSMNNLSAPVTTTAPPPGHVSQADLYNWLDRPPLGILHLMELFYTSKLHQLVLMDVTSLGVALSTQPTIGADVYPDAEDVESDYDVVYLLPRPHSVSAIMLPARSYQSFSRVGRVIEKMVEYSDSNKMWSLIFRDSEYLGDFHTSLLNSLRKCPQICSVSFSSAQRVEDDALLGHLVGQMPPSVRFVSFKSTLSRESIQALCILLRTHNAAFLNNDGESTSTKNARKRGGNKGEPPTPKTEGRADVGDPTRSKGLLGLALTHLTFEPAEINYIIELLQQRGPPKLNPAARHSSFKVERESSSGKDTGRDSTSSSGRPGSMNHPSIPVLSRGRSHSDGTPKSGSNPNTPLSNPRGSLSPMTPLSNPGGLRYLDLSYNALNDTTCARVLSAALSGPLEGLELGGNYIYRGVAFTEAMQMFTAERMAEHRHRLRYLGLSHNFLQPKALSGILESLLTNVSITALDLASNEIDHTIANNEMLRRFLRGNCGLRALDMCYNRLNAESLKEIHLGLLENETLLVLPMAGNQQVEISPTVNLIQAKLRENRILYKSQTRTDDYNAQAGKLDAYQTEEELGMRISFGFDFSEKEIAALNAGEYHRDIETAVEMELPLIAVEAQAVDAENCVAAPVRSNSGLSLMNPSLSRRNSRTAQTVLEENTASNAGAPASEASAEIKVPGYSIAIAVPVDAYSQRSPTVGNYNYNNGRARTFGSSGVTGSTAQPETQPQVESRTATTGTLDPNYLPSAMRPMASPATAPSAKSRPLSAALSSGAQSVVSDTTSLFGSPLRSPPESGKHAPDELGQALARHQSLASEGNDKFSNHTLNVMFSSPLVGFDRSAKPHPLEMLDYTSERELLMQVFKEVHRDVNVHFDFATTDTLRTALSFGCKALHFSGHGIPKGLCFEDGRLGLQVVKVNQLKDLLGAGGLQLQFVFVSACYSMEIGEAFVKAGVPHVVCVKVDTKIQDAAAIAFTRAFYVALLSGKTVKNSFSIAREALKLSPYVSDRVLEGDKFILLPDYSTVTGALQAEDFSAAAENHHNKAIFPSRPVVDWPMPGKHCTMGPNLIDVKAFLAGNRLPSPPADFEGREVVMHNVIRHILDRRLVSLVGEDGVGKSAVAAAICKYLSDREMFPDSIIYFRAKGHKDYRSFLSGLLSALLHSGCNSLATRLQALLSSQSSGPGAVNLVYPEEEVIFSCLESLRMLLVLDNLDELVAEYGESHTDFRIFLGRLFEQCPYVKVLVVSTDTLAMHNINVGFGIVEYSILLGPLTLISTLRLFARLAPSLSSASARKEFIAALQPARQMHVSVNSREINKTALQILSLLGDGHPAKIVHMACESTHETVEQLRTHGVNIISNSAAHTSSAASVSGYSVSMASFTSTPTLAGISGATPNMSTSTSYNAFDSSNL